MKSFIYILLLSITLNIIYGYPVKCRKYYTIENNDNCITISFKNEISRHRLLTLNPDLNCKNLVSGTNVCVKGKINISKDGTCGIGKGYCPFGKCCGQDGTCGSSPYHCGTGCNPNYGFCESTSKYMKHIKHFKDFSKKKFKDILKTFDREAITDIMEQLNMTEKQAKQFYFNANKGFSFFSNAFTISVNNRLSLNKCEELCNYANNRFMSLVNNPNNNFNLTIYNQYLESHQEPVIDKDYLYNNCVSKCFITKEIDENNAKENEENKMTLTKEKRFSNSTCEPISEGIITLVDSNYKNGIPLYQQEQNSTETAISYVNGCSIPLIYDLYNTNDYGLFIPVCNSHDVCYNCQIGKEECDNRLLNNGKNLCKIYNKWWQLIIGDYITCIGEVEIFYAAVKYAGQKAYDACKDFNTDPQCAFCGIETIQNELLEIPFYV